MKSLSFLSSANHELLKRLRSQLDAATDPIERQKINDELNRVADQRKPLRECTAEECQELKSQLFKHFNSLMQIGKTDQARQFQMMLTSVDLKIALIMKENQDKENQNVMEKRKEADALKLGPKMEKPVKKGTAKWNIDLGDF